ncbi:hypothetical protein VTN77DRAFT_997 [Rasamsonia byssochlamydoides]|uniref:uncharacterized protein n=1 Tax=Rasamsonia byssochlamydoides TaxID=89139 RepID=UPI0037445A28
MALVETRGGTPSGRLGKSGSPPKKGRPDVVRPSGRIRGVHGRNAKLQNEEITSPLAGATSAEGLTGQLVRHEEGGPTRGKDH